MDPRPPKGLLAETLHKEIDKALTPSEIVEDTSFDEVTNSEIAIDLTGAERGPNVIVLSEVFHNITESLGTKAQKAWEVSSKFFKKVIEPAKTVAIGLLVVKAFAPEKAQAAVEITKNVTSQTAEAVSVQSAQVTQAAQETSQNVAVNINQSAQAARETGQAVGAQVGEAAHAVGHSIAEVANNVYQHLPSREAVAHSGVVVAETAVGALVAAEVINGAWSLGQGAWEVGKAGWDKVSNVVQRVSKESVVFAQDALVTTLAAVASAEVDLAAEVVDQALVPVAEGSIWALKQTLSIITELRNSTAGIINEVVTGIDAKVTRPRRGVVDSSADVLNAVGLGAEAKAIKLITQGREMLAGSLDFATELAEMLATDAQKDIEIALLLDAAMAQVASVSSNNPIRAFAGQLSDVAEAHATNAVQQVQNEVDNFNISTTMHDAGKLVVQVAKKQASAFASRSLTRKIATAVFSTASQGVSAVGNLGSQAWSGMTNRSAQFGQSARNVRADAKAKFNAMPSGKQVATNIKASAKAVLGKLPTIKL